MGLRALRLLDPERAHGLALKALRSGLAGQHAPVTSDRLRTTIAGIDLSNPVGIAAGFDKNAAAVPETLRTGIGFCEIGAVTPRPQPGNPKPRLFRLAEDRAAINRFGFNNDGMEAIHANLVARPAGGIVGVNIGANKDSEDRAADFIAVLRRFHRDVAFATINVSSPNTERLRDLQGRAALDALLGRVLEARDDVAAESGRRLPVFLKIAPDLTPEDVSEIAGCCLAHQVDAITATNTTLARDGLRSANAAEQGGMSGAPLFDRSTEILRGLAREIRGEIPLIGAGGVSSAAGAYAKIRAGASAVQLYTGLVYAGISLGRRIAEDLDRLLERDGFANVRDAVGADLEDR